MSPPRRTRCLAFVALALALAPGLAACGPRVAEFDADPPDVETPDADPDAEDPGFDATTRCYVSGIFCSSHTICCSRFCNFATHRCR